MNNLNKIICLWLIAWLMAPAWGTIREWDGGDAGYSWSTAANWSDDTAPVAGDTALVDDATDDSILVDAGIKVAKIIVTGNYSGGMNFANPCTTTAGGYVDNGTGKRVCASAMVLTGATDTIHIGSGVGTVTATSCALEMNTATAGVIDDDKGVTFKTLTIGASDTVTNSGAAGTEYTSTSSPMTFLDGGRFTVNRQVTLQCNGAVDLISVPAGAPVINGTAQFIMNARTTGVNLPGLTYTGSGTIWIGSSSAATSQSCSLTGDLTTTGELHIFPYSGSPTFTFNTGNYNFSASNLFLGSNSATATFIFNGGSSALAVGNFNTTTYNAGTILMNTNASQITLSGNCRLGSNTVIADSGGTSTLTFNGTSGTQVYRDNRGTNKWYNWVKNGPAAVRCSTEAIIRGNITYTDGTMRMYDGATVSGDINFASNDTCDIRDTLTMYGANKTLTLGASAIPELTTLYFDVQGDKINVTNNSACPMVIGKLAVNAGDSVVQNGTNVYGIRTDKITLGASSVLGMPDDRYDWIISPSATADITLDATAKINNTIVVMSEAATLTTPAISVSRANILFLTGFWDGTNTYTTQPTKYTLGGDLTATFGLAGSGLVWFESFDHNDTIDCNGYNTNSDVFYIDNWNAQTAVWLGSGNHRTRAFLMSVYDSTGEVWPNDGIYVNAESCTWDSLENLRTQDAATAYSPNNDKIFIDWGTSTAYCDPNDNMHMMTWGKNYPHIVTNGCTYVAWYDSGVTVDTIARFECGGDSIVFPTERKIVIAAYTAGDWDGSAGNNTAWNTMTAAALCTLDLPNDDVTFTFTSIKDLILRSSGNLDSVTLAGGIFRPAENLTVGYMDIDDGMFLMGGKNLSCTDFIYGSDDSLAIDGNLNVSRHFTFDSTAGTKWYVHGDIDMTGTGNFLWNKGTSTNGLYGTLTQGHAGKTVTWLVPGKSNRYPVFRDGGKLVCASATGDIAGYLTYFNESIANDTILQTNGATLSADSGEIEISANDAGNHYIDGFNAPNIFVNFRPYHEADTCRFYYLGDLNVYRVNCNTQLNYRGEHLFADHALTIGAGGFGVGSNGSTVHTLFDRTGGTFTSAGAFTVDGETDFNAGSGSYAVAGNLTIGAGTNNLGAAAWTLNGVGAQALSADTLYKLTINKAGGTVTTSKSIGLGTDFTLTAGGLDISGSDTMYFGGNVTTSSGTITTAATSLWKVLKDGATLAMNALSWPITALTGSATIEDGGTFAELRPDAAGADTVKFEKLKKFNFTASDSTYWNGGTGALNYYLTTTAGTRCTLNFEGTKRFRYTAWKDVISLDTLYVNDGTSISLGGNLWP